MTIVVKSSQLYHTIICIYVYIHIYLYMLTSSNKRSRSNNTYFPNSGRMLKFEILEATADWSDAPMSLSCRLMFADSMGEIRVVLRPHREAQGSQLSNI